MDAKLLHMLAARTHARAHTHTHTPGSVYKTQKTTSNKHMPAGQHDTWQHYYHSKHRWMTQRRKTLFV